MSPAEHRGGQRTCWKRTRSTGHYWWWQWFYWTWTNAILTLSPREATDASGVVTPVLMRRWSGWVAGWTPGTAGALWHPSSPGARRRWQDRRFPRRGTAAPFPAAGRCTASRPTSKPTCGSTPVSGGPGWVPRGHAYSYVTRFCCWQRNRSASFAPYFYFRRMFTSLFADNFVGREVFRKVSGITVCGHLRTTVRNKSMMLL